MILDDLKLDRTTFEAGTGWQLKPEGACKGQRCTNLAQTDGYCRSCWKRRLGLEGGWFLADKVVDWLTLDGGWLTAEGVADELGHHIDSVERVLRQLRDRGQVESKQVALAYGPGNFFEKRTEWRTV